jgi:hypothetical protein
MTNYDFLWATMVYNHKYCWQYMHACCEIIDQKQRILYIQYTTSYTHMLHFVKFLPCIKLHLSCAALPLDSFVICGRFLILLTFMTSVKHKFPLKIGADEKLKTSNKQLIIKIAKISLLLALISLLYVHVFINLGHKYIIY